MGLHFKTAAGLLLLIQSFHLASFQNSTNSPAITIDRTWLRELARNKSVSPNDALTREELEYDERGQPPIESSGGIPSGAMAIFPGEEDNLTAEGSGDEDHMFTSWPLNVTFTESEPPDGNMSSTNNVSDGASESNQTNITDTTEVPDNQTATPRNNSSDPSVQNVTSAEDLGNHTDATTASPPQDDVTEEGSTPTAAKDWNSTDESDTTVPHTPEATTVVSATTVVGSATTVNQTDTAAATPTTSPEASTATPTTSPEASTAVDLNTPEGANKTGKVVADGSSSDRGLDSDATTSKKSYWLAVLGTLVAVVFVVAVTYVVLKRKYQRDYSHRKLIEDYPSEPVLRLDNCEPLDLNFGRMAYHNPGLQEDNIQMSDIPRRH